ncbi:MAG: hypothetical protein NC937_00030 [Candidatus Omnitrophica bacterium]|nr:hypothetical protein [Candidatus Omnitrophota bacterium]MCM8824529.1 hypothetical protein [Candidatus Omnitrophota bacterium]
MKKTILLCFVILLTVLSAFAKKDVTLAKEKRALFDVFISENASERTEENVVKFVEYLYKIAGASFKVSTGNSDTGIIVGTIEEFPFPSIRVEPNAIVNIATHQRKGGHTLDELIDGWKQKSAIIGISDAFCTYLCDRALPGRPRVSDITYLTENLPFMKKNTHYQWME